MRILGPGVNKAKHAHPKRLTNYSHFTLYAPCMERDLKPLDIDGIFNLLADTGVERRVRKVLAIQKHFPTDANHAAALIALRSLPEPKRSEIWQSTTAPFADAARAADFEHVDAGVISIRGKVQV